MSVLIKGMKMPTSCSECKLFDASHAIGLFAPLGWCKVNGKEIFHLSKKADNCPLVEIPPHGRLIEKGKTLDACYTHFEDYMNGKIDGKTALLNIEKEIKAAPTIIPASGGNEDE